MTSSHPSILIVGAGPAGLVLALSLLQNDIPVRIIAKEQEFRRGQRGAGIMPRTLELHSLLKTLPDVFAKGISTPLIRSYKLPGGTEILKEFNIESEPVMPSPDSPYSRMWLLGQANHEALLRAHLAKYNCHVELGTELRSLEQKNDHVVAHIATTKEDGNIVETHQEFKWIIGADGGRSTVRRQLPNVSFLGETRVKESWVVGDIHVLKGLDEGGFHLWGDAMTSMISLRPTEDDGCCTILCVGKDMDHAQIASSRDAFVEFFGKHTGRTDIEFGDIVWLSHYTPNIRMVNEFLHGRVLLTGDAAHTHSFTGGQGMNTSVQDSLNLGWKLALVEKGLASPALLSSYNTERLPVVAEMLNISTALLDKTFSSKVENTWHRGANLYGLGVNYRHSPIVIDERTSAEEKAANKSVYMVDSTKPIRAGDRARDAPGLITRDGKTTSIFEIIGSVFHTIFVFTNDAAAVKDLLVAVQKYPAGTKLVVISPAETPALDIPGTAAITLEDREGHGFKGYNIEGEKPSVFAVRPDGVVGAIVFGVEGLQAYFKLIFV